MSTPIETILQQEADSWAVDVRESQRKRKLVATDKSAQSLRGVVTRSGSALTVQLRGAKWWIFQVKGRGPGRGKRPARALVEGIRNWLQTGKPGLPVGAAYAIAMNIHKRGIQVPNRFNDGKVLSEPLNRQVVANRLIPRLRRYYVSSIRAQIL